MAKRKNYTAIEHPFKHGLPPGNLTAELAARMPHFRGFTRIRPRRTSRGERLQPTTKNGARPARPWCRGLANTLHSTQ